MRTILAILAITVLITADDSSSTTNTLSRVKRQSFRVYYLCNNRISQYPCNYNYNNYYPSNYLPNSFYDAYNNCNSGCNNIACNNYQGQYMNGIFVAYSPYTNQYSSCASSCCIPDNNNNNNYIIGNGAIPNTVIDPNNPSIGQGEVTEGISKRQVNSCQSGTSSIGQCVNGQCPYNLMCTWANQCCLCSSGTSIGPCQGYPNGCPSGYNCVRSGQCCPNSGSRDPPNGGLQRCGYNRSCPRGYTCGDGNVCFPHIVGG